MKTIAVKVIKAFIPTTAVKAVKPFCWNHNFTALLYAFKGKLLWPKFIVWTISNSCKTRRLITLDKLVNDDVDYVIKDVANYVCMIVLCCFRLWRAVGSYKSCPGLTYSRSPPRQRQTCVHHARYVRRRGLHRLPDR